MLLKPRIYDRSATFRFSLGYMDWLDTMGEKEMKKIYKEICEEIGEVRFWAVMGVGLAVVAWAYRINL